MAAEPAIAALYARFEGRHVTRGELEAALRAVPRYSGGCQLAGWLMDEQPSAFVWKEGSLNLQPEAIIGSGSDWFRSEVELPREGGTIGTNLAPEDVPATVCRTLTSIGSARFQEILFQKDWDRTWGEAYDVVVFNGHKFDWLDSVLYVGWDLYVDSTGNVVHTYQAPVSWKTEFVHGCTIIYAGSPKEGRLTVSPPIHRKVDDGPLRRRTFTMKATWYVNYFRFWRGTSCIIKVCMTVCNPDENGPMYSRGAWGSETLEANRTFLSDLFKSHAPPLSRCDVTVMHGPGVERWRRAVCRGIEIVCA